GGGGAGVVGVEVGGSLAKGTLVRKDLQDIDIFVVFENEDATKELGGILKKAKLRGKVKHGSRDYFQIVEGNVIFEIIPVVQVDKKKPEDAENVTDVSLMHVDYVKKKIRKNKKLSDEIKLAKVFCHACGCYGAESYIGGLSGYGLEVLVIYFGGFVKFLKWAVRGGGGFGYSNSRFTFVNDVGPPNSRFTLEDGEKFVESKSLAHPKIVKSKSLAYLRGVKNKSNNLRSVPLVIDPEKYFKNGNEVLQELNASKLQSPLVVVDPTYKFRNITAGLSYPTFCKFVNYSKKFLKSPSVKMFEKKEFNISVFEKLAKKKKARLLKLKLTTDRQEGDIAGTKMKKFFDFLIFKLKKKEQEVLAGEFVYGGAGQEAEGYLVVKEKKEIEIGGVDSGLRDAVKNFKKVRKKTYVRGGKVYAKEKVDIDKVLKRANGAGVEMGASMVSF
ncbi:hypothetical protein CMI37_39005, partial [Candidatus Pacearchaeota archaeon]|nr:hypothetical protein [Candidatus Pacearchaeota archaeon]